MIVEDLIKELQKTVYKNLHVYVPGIKDGDEGFKKVTKISVLESQTIEDDNAEIIHILIE